MISFLKLRSVLVLLNRRRCLIPSLLTSYTHYVKWLSRCSSGRLRAHEQPTLSPRNEITVVFHYIVFIMTLWWQRDRCLDYIQRQPFFEWIIYAPRWTHMEAVEEDGWCVQDRDSRIQSESESLTADFICIETNRLSPSSTRCCQCLNTTTKLTLKHVIDPCIH